MITITDHAYKRAKERLSLSKKAFKGLAETAYTKGISHGRTNGKLKKYVTNLWTYHGTANNIRIYGEVIYLFRFNILITVFQIPNELKKNLKYCKTKL